MQVALGLKQPTVSILIPCYNAERWIAQCIESALNQTYANKEVIVVDDGSTDGSLEIIKSFGEQICWETGPNRGGNVARNRLLELSSGEWLQYLDADDYLLPNKIEEQIKVLQKEPDADVICSPAIAEYHEGEKIWRGSSASLYPRDPWILLAKWALPQTGGSLWCKQALLEVGSWKTDQMCCQEHELYCRLLMNSKKFAYLDEPLAVYRLWSDLTVSRKDPRKPYHYRLLIKDTLETYLNQMNMLTEERRYEIYTSRFDCARSVYQFDQVWALSIISKIRTKYPDFIPRNQSGSRFYTIFYLLGGFLFAEKLAQLYRTLSIVLKK